MARTADPSRKPALLEQILDYLLDKPLSALTFRTLASALDISTYTLVYQFGTRAELIRDIVGAISSRAGLIQERLASDNSTLDTYFEGLVMSWEWTLLPRNRQLQRLEFEAGMLEALDPAEFTFTRALYQHWHSIGRNALSAFGLSADDAEVESRLLVNTFQGIQYDLLLNRDDAGATAAFDRAMHIHRDRIETLLAAAT
ncbi:MAG: TetR/AcrR family transcriptional regulator [Rhodoglobus sp.]